MVQLSCDFEIDICAWIDTAPDGYSWTRTSGATTSYPRTGPSSDHTTGSGSYVFTEATGRYYKLHQLESPRVSLQQDATLSFAYHMYGRDMGTLSIEAYDIETGWSTLWSRIGKQGAEWRDAAVVLPASATKVRFSGKTGSGWKSDMALDDVLFSQFAPPSPPPIPPPPPVTPPSPPFPPSPPLAPGFVATASEAELRSLIAEAAADISIYLPPGVHVELGSQISCGAYGSAAHGSNIKVTVASSGEGATLDGKGGTGLFYLDGGCSLTLRGLLLVNGRAYHGGVVEAIYAGDVEIIDSTIRDCRADDVRRVELAVRTAAPGTAAPGARHPAPGARRCSARLPHPGLTSQPQDGGVVYAWNSGAVSLTGLTVTSCSALVRRVVLAASSSAVQQRGER